MNTKRIKSAVERAVQQASFSLRQDVHRLLRRAYLQEHNKKAKKALGWILENAKVAQSQKLALCQDTGLPIVFIEIGRDTKFSSSLLKAVKQGVEDGYRKNYLRASSVDPFKRTNPSYRGLIHHIDFSPKPDELTITVFPKGFGSENKSQLKMFNPTASRDEIEEFIVEAAKHAGAESCPPFVVGVGIGGSCDHALLLAKKALLQRVDKPNPDKSLNMLEKRLFEKINSLKIGAMGLGGSWTALAVKVKSAPTHIAGLPVGVNISCHALRSSTVKI